MWADLIQWVEGLSLTKGWAGEFALCLAMSHLEPSHASGLSLELHCQFSWFSVLGTSWTLQFMSQALKIIPFYSLWHSCISGQTHTFSSVQSLSHVWLFATPWIAAHQASLSITNSRSLLKLMSIELVMPSSHLIPCLPLLLLPAISPSIRVFSNESTLPMRWAKYWSFSFNISPSNEHPGLISFRMDWLDLLAVQGTLKSLLQHRSSRASILQHSVFFIINWCYY